MKFRGTVPPGSNSLVRRPHSGCFLLRNMQPFARSGRWGAGFKSRLLPPSRSAPIGVNCIPFEMGEVCLALQRDLQPPTHPPVRLLFLLHFVAHRSRIRVVSAAAADYFFGFRLQMRCRGGLIGFVLQSFGSEGGRVARLRCLAELQSNQRGCVLCFCAACVACGCESWCARPSLPEACY